MPQPVLLQGCTPGCRIILDGFGKCGFRTGRECPRPYTAADIRASAAWWDLHNSSHAEANAIAQHSAETACRTRLRQRSPAQLRAGAFCLRMLPQPPSNFTIRSTDGNQRHSYTMPATLDHGAAIGGVARVLHELLRGRGKRPFRSLLDLGAGMGQYGRALHALDARHRYAGYDGAGNIESASGGRFVRYAEFSLPLSLPRAHWVLSIDTGEHLPRAAEMMFMRNIYAHACVGVIISWANLIQGGSGHQNVHNPDYIRQTFEALDFDLDERLTHLLRNQSDVDEPPYLVENFVAMRRRRRIQPCA